MTCGVMPSGGNDDSEQLQQAIKNVGAGGTVYFNPGTYHLNTAKDWVAKYDRGQYKDDLVPTALSVAQPNVTLAGPPDRSAVLKLEPKTRMRVVTAKETASNFSIRNLTVDGNAGLRAACTVPRDRAQCGWGYGDVVDALVYGWLVASAFTVDNIEVRNTIEDAVGCWGCSGVTVRNSSFNNIGTAPARRGSR